jgi:hypothetical protein
MSSNLSLCPVCEIDLNDTLHTFPLDVSSHRFCRDTGEVTRDEDGDPVWFVNIYETDRIFGGPEEGGWYYDAGHLMATYQISGSYDNAANLMEDVRNGEWESTGNSGSVTYSGGDYDYEITLGAPGVDFYPEERPFYE